MENEKRNFDTEAANWDQEPRRVKLAKDLFAAIAATVPLNPSMEALDFGCGTGLVTLPLAARTGRVTGVDSSRGMLGVLENKARQQGVANIAVHYSDAGCDDIPDASCDLVVTTMALHHLRDIPPLLAQFFRILREGGHVCIADLDVEGGLFHENNDGVFHLGFNREDFRKMLMEAGFVNIAYRTAATMDKPDANGQPRAFTVFLIAGRRQAVCMGKG